MIIDCISDLHGFYPQLDGGDLLIVAGDLTARDMQTGYLVFRDWLRAQDYKKKIFIAGNHDGCIEKGLFYFNNEWMGADYLYDSGTTYEGLKIWGSPWTKTFEGMNPKCKAFTYDKEDELAVKFSLIPEDTNILITHSPEYYLLDEVEDEREEDGIIYCGSIALGERCMQLSKLKLHVVGHIHEGYGQLSVRDGKGNEYTYVNASHINQYYKPVNKPIRVIL